jgi:glycosyltransferase involved in cell wall biosynthesis
MEIEKVSVVVPAYNEEEAIAADLEVVLETMKESRWDYEVIVVNDASTDNTAEIVKRFENRGVKLIQHRENRGGGFARNTGIKGSTGDVVVVTDGDGTYPNQDIPRLLDAMEERDLDMVVGARKKEAGTLKVLRTPAKWFIRKLAMWMSGFNIPDLNSGLRAMQKEVFLEFMELLPWGHSWVSTITLAMLSSAYSVEWIEIDYFPRKGSSTFHPIKDTYGYLTLVIRTVTWFNPLKIFMPLVLLLGAIGVTKLIYDMIIHPFYITSNTIILLMAFLQVLVLALLADLIAKRRK